MRDLDLRCSGPKACFARLLPARAQNFEGIGVACPGPLDPYTGIIGDRGDTAAAWQGCNLVAELEPEFGVPVAVENDADAVALAEANWGAAKGSERFIYITVSTGIGGGIIFSGKLYRGADGSHPELGHQVIDASGPLVLLPSARLLGKPGERQRDDLLDAAISSLLPLTSRQRRSANLPSKATHWRGVPWIGRGSI